MVNDVELNKVGDASANGRSFFAELSVSADYANAEGELPILIGKDENGVVTADLCELPHVLVYSTKCHDLSAVFNATILSLVDKNECSHVNFVVFDLDGMGLANGMNLSDAYFWAYPSKKENVVTEQKTALRILDCLVKEIDDRYELLRKSRTHNIKEYGEAMSEGKIAKSSEFPAKPNVVVFVADYWRFVNESKAAEISLVRIAELGKSVGIYLVAATKEQPEIMNADVLASFPSRIVFKTATPEASQALLFASDAVDLGDEEIVFVKDKYFSGLKNPRKIMTEGSIDVEFANKVTSIDSGLAKLRYAVPDADDLLRVTQKQPNE